MSIFIFWQYADHVPEQTTESAVLYLVALVHFWACRKLQYQQVHSVSS